MRSGETLALSLAAVVCGCAAEVVQEPDIVWPAPPEKPRIKFLRTLRGESDFKRSSPA